MLMIKLHTCQVSRIRRVTGLSIKSRAHTGSLIAEKLKFREITRGDFKMFQQVKCFINIKFKF